MEEVKDKLESLLQELEAHLRTTASDAGLTSSSSKKGKSGGSGSSAEVDNAVESLTDKGQLVLQHLNKRNEELDLEKREAQSKLAEEACEALMLRMESEEEALGQAAADKGHSSATRGLLEPRRQELCEAVTGQLEAMLKEGSEKSGECSPERLLELVQRVESATHSKLAELKADRVRVLTSDLEELTKMRCAALKAVVKKEILPLANDTTDDDFSIPSDTDGSDYEGSSAAAGGSGGGGSRVGLSELLQRLSTAADLAFSLVAAKANVPPNPAAAVPPGHGLAEEVRRMVKESKRDMDEVVAAERLNIQLAKVAAASG